MQDLSLFPPEARCVFHLTDDAGDLTYYEHLHPDERNVVKAAVDVRKGEFGDARWCAHQALRELGVAASGAILRGERGMPLWPEGYTGSLTHTDGLRAAVAASTRHVHSMGLDAEPAEPLPAGVLHSIASETEIAMVERMRVAGHEWADRLLFCAKEATYKCWYPMTRRWLDFDEAEIELRADGTFISQLLARPAPVPVFEGRWVVRGGYVIASTYVR